MEPIPARMGRHSLSVGVLGTVIFVICIQWHITSITEIFWSAINYFDNSAGISSIEGITISKVGFVFLRVT